MSEYTPTTKDIRDAWWSEQCAKPDLDFDDIYNAAFDRWLEAHDAEVRAAVVAEQGEPEGRRWFSAAYRARNGNIIPIGDENLLREFPEALVEEFRREDPEGPDYFLASRTLPPWLPVEDPS